MGKIDFGSRCCQRRFLRVGLFPCYCLLALVCHLSARALEQDSGTSTPQNQQGGSDEQSAGSDLAAAAKRAKEERAQQSARKTERSQAVDEMAQELALSQDEPIAGAPQGYRYYYFQPGDYAILVPGDAKPESRDGYGLHLRSSEVFSWRVELIFGEPLPARGSTPEEILHNANDAYFEGCSVSISGVGPPVNGHPAHDMAYQKCGWPANLIGPGELVVGDGYVVPVLCGYPKNATETDPRRSPKEMLRSVNTQRQAYETCGTILSSVKFHPFGNRWTAKKVLPAQNKPVLTAAASMAGSTAQESSLGAFARAHRKTPQKSAVTELNGDGQFQPYSFRYFCSRDRSVCLSANLQIPPTAKVNQQFPSTGKGLFQFEVPVGRAIAIIQGNKGTSTDTGILTREQMINGKMAWFLSYVPAEQYSGVKPATVLNEQLTEIGGFPARTATFRNETLSKMVVTYMTVYMLPGAFFHVRCTVPEDSSGDAQSLCERVTQSLEFPKQLGEDNKGDDPPGDDEQ